MSKETANNKIKNQKRLSKHKPMDPMEVHLKNTCASFTVAQDIFDSLLDGIAEGWRQQAISAKARPYAMRFTVMSGLIAVMQTKFTNDKGDRSVRDGGMYNYEEESEEPVRCKIDAAAPVTRY